MHHLRFCLALTFGICTVLLVAGTAEAQEFVIAGSVTMPQAKKKARPTSRYQRRTAALATPEKQRAIVYLEGAGIVPNKQNLQAEMGQRSLQFAPQLLPVQVGTTVLFPNYDEEFHSVFSFSKNSRFDLGRFRKDEEPGKQTFMAPGIVKVYCEIHKTMRGTILVLETPYFTVTDDAGNYTLKTEQLAPGEYQLTAWISPKVSTSQSLVVGKDTTYSKDFAF